MNDAKRREKMDAIADAAYRLLDERGYGGTSMLSIAKAAKASNETLYNWYGDKTGLFRALVDRNAADTARVLEAGVAQGTDPLDTLEQAGAELLCMLLGPRAIALNRAAAANPTGELGAAIAVGGRARIAPMVADLLARAVASQRLAGAADEITEAFFALLIGDSQIRRAIGTLPPPTAESCAKRAATAVAAIARLFASSSKDETTPLDATSRAD